MEVMTMAEYTKIETARAIICDFCNQLYSDEPCEPADCDWLRMLEEDAADVAPVVHCKDCKHSTLPSELTQRYGKPGTLTCHNMHAPSNRRNVGSNDFCSYGEREEND
jgi:hypothetical protein